MFLQVYERISGFVSSSGIDSIQPGLHTGQDRLARSDAISTNRYKPTDIVERFKKKITMVTVDLAGVTWIGVAYTTN